MGTSGGPVGAAKTHAFARVLAALVFACVLAPGAAPARGADIDPQIVAAAKKEGRVTFYSPLIVDQILRPLVAAFRAKYGIPVDYIRMDSDAVVLKVINEYRAHRAAADVFTTSLGIEPLIASGAIRKFRSGNVDELPAQYRDPNGYWVADRIYVLEPAINTKLVPVSERPKSFEDLLDPKWAGKMAWRPTNLTGATGFIANVLTSMGEEKGMDYLRKLAKQRVVTLSMSDRAVLDQVVAGEYPMALAMTNHNVEISHKEGAPVDWIPLQGMIFSEQMGLTAQGPHPNAALLFLDYTLSREGQTLFRNAGYIPARPDVPPLNPKLLPAAGGFKATVATPAYVEKNRKHWDDVFRQLFR
ncbi:MAG TPA: extracellular solute-binding protein [Micropepsaceae bacterium]|nr:extracellular solute-binding protein [Micropepsaceae bacterium]